MTSVAIDDSPPSPAQANACFRSISTAEVCEPHALARSDQPCMQQGLQKKFLQTVHVSSIQCIASERAKRVKKKVPTSATTGKSTDKCIDPSSSAKISRHLGTERFNSECRIFPSPRPRNKNIFKKEH